MRKYFFAGFLTLLPIALTLIIAVWLFNLFTAPFAGIIESILHHYEGQQEHATLVIFLSRILSFIFLIFLIFFLGFFGRQFFLKLFFQITDRLFSRIPLVRTIYRLSHDVTKAVFSDTKKTFKETVLTPFPNAESLAIGFVTGDAPPIFKAKAAVDLAVFVPTAPHPMSGFVLLTPSKRALPVDVSVEEAFKFLISCGVIHPGETKQ